VLAGTAITRNLANERLIDRMMLLLASGVLALVLLTSIPAQAAGGVRFSPAFYVVTALYLLVTLVGAHVAPRLGSIGHLERLRWTVLTLTLVAMLSMSYFLGGANWIGAQPLFFLVFGAAFTPNPWRAVLIVVAGVSGYVGVSVLTATGALPAQTPLGGPMHEFGGGALAATLAYTTLALALYFVLSGVIGFLLTLQRDALATTTDELADSKRELEELNARLEERVTEKTRELEERYRELHVMAEIGKIVNASLDVDNVYLEFIGEVRKLLPFDQASIAVFGRDRSQVRLLRALVEDGVVRGTNFDLAAERALSVSGKPQIFADFSRESDAWVERDYLVKTGAVCGASVPIFSKGVLIGSFNVVSNRANTYEASHVALMERAVEPLALAMENARLYDEMRAIADTDGLTGLPNRRSLERTLAHEIARAERNGGNCSVLVMDIDNFKTFNDTLGHQAGDEVLVTFAGMLRETCRETDVVGRQSGDEFTVVLPDTRSEEAFALAQRIHDAMRRAAWRYPGEQGAAVTTSIGVATHPYDGSDGETLLSRADSAMYVAKAAGGGQTRLSSDVVEEQPGNAPRQVRFALVETLAGAAAERMNGGNAEARTLTAFTVRAAVQIASQLGLDDAEQRALRVAAMSHALAIFPGDDPYGHEERWGLDPAMDGLYLKLGRLFVAASPGLDETLRAVERHHRPWDALDGSGESRMARVLAVAETYARLTMPRFTEADGDAALSPGEAVARMKDDVRLDRSVVEQLGRAVDVEAAPQAA